MAHIREHLTWIEKLLSMTSKARKLVREKVIAALQEEIENENSGYDPQSIEQIVEALDSKHFEFVGFMPNVTYAKESGDKDEMRALFVHPFGYPTLLYKHKRSPVYVFVNPLLRFNGSVLHEIPYSEYKKFMDKGVERPEEIELRGITG